MKHHGRRPQPAPLLDLMSTPATGTGMAKLDSLRNWRLLKGSHRWPGPDGGTCILEAAIVVAGLPYRRVATVDDAPADFSWVVSEYLLALNDWLPDGTRQGLIPYVTRLPGSAAAYQVENERLRFIVGETTRHILPALLDAFRWRAFAEGCRAAPAGAPGFAVFDRLVARLRWSGVLPRRHRPSRLASAAEVAVFAAVDARQARRETLQRIAAIVDEALKLGRQAEPIDRVIALERLEQACAKQPMKAQKAC